MPLLLLPHVLLQAGVVPAGLQGPQEGGHLVGPQGLREVSPGPALLPAMTPSPSPDLFVPFLSVCYTQDTGSLEVPPLIRLQVRAATY